MDVQDLNQILSLAGGLLRQAHGMDSPIKPTDFYEEGWMTSLTMAVVAETGIDLPPFRITPTARWWREGLLRSPFNRKFRGDQRGEGLTHADTVIGHFDRRGTTKRGIAVRANATQLDVVEAKINSPLSGRTSNATGFDQAARSVACMAFELDTAHADLTRFGSLGFYVVSSEEYMATHQGLLTRDSIEQKVRARIANYDEPWRSNLVLWCEGPFRRLLDRISLQCFTLESVINQAKQVVPTHGQMLDAFYQQCRDLR